MTLLFVTIVIAHDNILYLYLSMVHNYKKKKILPENWNEEIEAAIKLVEEQGYRALTKWFYSLKVGSVFHLKYKEQFPTFWWPKCKFPHSPLIQIFKTASFRIGNFLLKWILWAMFLLRCVKLMHF